MIKEYNRHLRVAQVIQKEIANVLQNKIKDPRINMITVSGVEVSYDLTYAKVFVTFLKNNTIKELKTKIFILNNATGFIRSLLSKNICLRIMPKLTFFYDYSLTNGIRISQLINKAIQNNNLDNFFKNQQ